jgi:DNA-binding beta-propeller fold protein YncE
MMATAAACAANLTRRRCSALLCALLGCTLLAGGAASAQIVIIASDGHLVLEDGKVVVARRPGRDTVSVIRLGRGEPVTLGQLEVPTTALGPPMSVAVSPDERLALVTAAVKADPRNPGEQIPDDAVSVIDLRAAPPRLLQTVHAGAGASGVSITPDGRLALVANRSAGSVSVLRIDAGVVTPVQTLVLGSPQSGVSHVAISPDGTRALVTRTTDNTVSELAISPSGVRATGRDFGVGLGPYGVVISPDGRLAIVANVSLGRGDDDTISVIDMTARPIRTVDTLSVGMTPEGIAISPDGRWCAIVLLNGSNKPPRSPDYRHFGAVVLYGIDGLHLRRRDAAQTGPWPQGAAFSADGRTLLVESMSERDVRIFSVALGGRLHDTGKRIALPGGGAAIRTAERFTSSIVRHRSRTSDR